MANKKITDLSDLPSPAGADVLPIVDDVSGSPVTKKVTVNNLIALAPQGDLLASNNLSDVASASTSRTNLGLGDAATKTVGTSNGNVVALDSTGLPAVDGSQLTGITATDSTKLAIASNLSDLNNAGTARTNLGLGDAATKTVGTADTNVIGVSSGTVDLGGNKLEDFDASINEQTGTTYTLVAGDNGKVIKFTNGSAITLTLPSGLGEGFNCTVIQYGAGQITFSTSSSTLYNRQSHTKTAGQYAVAGLISCVADVFVLAGDTAS
jgi:hypothetical protein